MSTQQKFTAAINVIRSLPKNGSYQPSKELLLRFYAYYKQATIGRNDQPKPNFWDVVNRAKWQAWDNLGDMSKEDAMQAYVDELKKIVETMAYTNPVADFVSSLDSFYESVSIDDLEMVVGPIDRGNKTEKPNTSGAVPINEHSNVMDTDIDEECFHDVMESAGELKKTGVIQKDNQYPRANEYNDELVNRHIPLSQQNGTSAIQCQRSNERLDGFQKQIRNTVSSMKVDLDIIANKVAQLEALLNEMKAQDRRRHIRISRARRYRMLFLIGWPVIVQFIFVWFRRRNRRKTVVIL